MRNNTNVFQPFATHKKSIILSILPHLFFARISVSSLLITSDSAMPRATRAALRAQELLDDATHDAAAIALPSTPNKERVVLGEISSNVSAGNEVSAPDVSEVTGEPPKSKSNKKAGRKGKGSKHAMEEDGPIEVLEDDSCSSKSEAAVEASHLLLDKNSSGNFPPPSTCSTELTIFL